MNSEQDKRETVSRMLRQYRALVANHQACKELYESLYPSIATSFSESVIMPSKQNYAEDSMVKILDHRAYCLRSLIKQAEEIRRIDDAVNSLPADEQLIVRKYYMCARWIKMEEIAEEIHASVESCWRWRRKAIDSLVEMMAESEKLTVNDSK